MFETGAELPRVIADLGHELDVAIIRAEREQRLAATPPPRRTRSRRRGFAIAFAGLSAVAIALFLVIGFNNGGTQVGVQDALADVADRILVAPHPTPRQFQYSKSRGTGTGQIEGGIDQMGRLYKTFLYKTSNESEWAISIVRNGRGRMRGGSPTYPTAEDKKNGQQYFDSFKEHDALYETAAGRKRLRPINRRIMAYNKAQGVSGTIGIDGPEWAPATWQANGQLVFGGEMLTPAQLAKYPRDPKAIYERMSALAEKQWKELQASSKTLPAKQRAELRGGPDAQDNLWQYLTESNIAPLPADLLAARARALAYFPGVEAAGEATDAFGREGEKFVWSDGVTRSEILFDKKTSVLLMSRATVVDPKRLSPESFRRLPVGAVTGSYQLVEQKTLNYLPKFD
ncbi:MAG: hypothetical protein JHD02_09965 [Thermoleophilaceae bacterium]|nr:hypothetical protein [Thermoleophilaceae bacterium]